MDSVNTQSDYKTKSKKWTDKLRKQTCFVCFLNVWIPRKQVQVLSKEFLGNKNNINKKKFFKKPPVTMIITWSNIILCLISLMQKNANNMHVTVIC